MKKQTLTADGIPGITQGVGVDVVRKLLLKWEKDLEQKEKELNEAECSTETTLEESWIEGSIYTLNSCLSELKEETQGHSKSDGVVDGCVPKELAKRLKNEIDMAYRNRDDYPPFAIAPWDDRGRYREYIFKIIDEVLS